MRSKKTKHQPKHIQLALELVERYRFIRALHTCYYNLLGADVTGFASEFFFLVGDVIEGKPIDEAALRFINMDRVREFLKEDK